MKNMKVYLEERIAEKPDFTKLYDEAVRRLRKGVNILPYPFPLFEKKLLREAEEIKLEQTPLPQTTPTRTILKVRNVKRGFGACTLAMFLNEERKWDYVEIVQPGTSEYQSSCRALEEPEKVLGKTLSEIKNMQGVQILRGKWHSATITPSGKILNLIC